MKSFTYHRLFGYATTLLLHLGNFYVLTIRLEKNIPTYPDLKIYSITHFQPRYLTIWNVLFQIFYASLSLYVELKMLKKKDSVSEKLIKFRNDFFCAIVLPFAVLVVSLFWPIFSYDRNLVFPTRADIFVSKVSNHILHSFVLLVPLWELVFQERSAVTSHTKRCWSIFSMYCIYNTVLFYTKYGDIGLWPYQILDVLEGTIFFHLFFLYILLTLYISYFLQFHVKDRIWSLRDRITVKVA